MKTPFHIIIISAESDFIDEAKIVSALFTHGLQTFHVRKPGWSIEQTQQYLESIPKEFYSKIVLHNHFQLTNVFAVKGIHLNEENKKIIEQLKTYKIISASYHSLQDLEYNIFPYEYIFLSPIFNSISKAGHYANFDLGKLAVQLKALKQNNQPLPDIYALGGVSAANMDAVKQTGFNGAALLGAIWQNENPVKAFLEIKNAIN